MKAIVKIAQAKEVERRMISLERVDTQMDEALSIIDELMSSWSVSRSDHDGYSRMKDIVARLKAKTHNDKLTDRRPENL